MFSQGRVYSKRVFTDVSGFALFFQLVGMFPLSRFGAKLQSIPRQDLAAALELAAHNQALY